MTICFFSAQYLPTIGGVERYTFSLAQRCVAAGHKALVVTSALPGLPVQERTPEGIAVYRLPVWSMMDGRFPVVKPGRGFAAQTRAIWAQRPDFCVVQTKMYPQSVWAAVAARRRRIPTIVIDHSTGFMPVGGGVIGWAGRCYERLACAIIKAQKPAFYGVSAAVCRWLQSFSITAAGRLPNAVDPAALAALAAGTPTAPPRRWRVDGSGAPLPQNARLVAYVGRLIPEKGAAALVEAVRELPDTYLVVAGDGPLLAELRKTAPANVLCPGSVPYAETVQLLSQADVYCLPTLYAEGFPTTLLEAAACHCPILCTATAGTEELLPTPDHGILLPSADAQAIRAGLCALLDAPARASACAETCYENLCQHFTWQVVFDKMMEIANRAAKEPKCPNC